MVAERLPLQAFFHPLRFTQVDADALDHTCTT